MGLLGSLFKGVGKLLGNVVSGATQDTSQRNQNYALEQMERQNQYNIDAFNRENEYNSPLNQRLRAQQAGINANWTDSAGSVVAQQDSGVSPSVTTGSNGVDLAGLINAGLSLSKLKSEKNLLDEQAANVRADTENKKELTRGQGLHNNVFEQTGLQDAISGINEKVASAAQKNASAEEINKLLGVRRTLLEAQTYLANQEGDAAEKNAETNAKNADTNAKNADINQQNADTAAAGQKETARHNKVSEKIEQQNSDIAAAGQKETARHNKVSEKIEQRKNEIQSLAQKSLEKLQFAQSKDIRASEIQKVLANGVEASLIKNGVKSEQIRVAIDETAARAAQAYADAKARGVDVSFSDWVEKYKDNPIMEYIYYPLKNIFDLVPLRDIK